MSHQTFDSLLREAVTDLSRILTDESLEGNKQLVQIYVDHVLVYNKLYSVLTQMAHPQKLQLARKLFENFAGRLVDIKLAMLRSESSCEASVKDNLAARGLTANDLDVRPPLFMIRERSSLINEQLAEALKVCSIAHAEPVSFPEQEMDINFAIRVLQTNERGRQAKIRARFMKEIQQRTKFSAKMDQQRLSGSDIHTNASKMVQRAWRKYKSRARKQELHASDVRFTTDVKEVETYHAVTKTALSDNETARETMQREHISAFVQAQADIASSLQQSESQGIKRDMMSSFRDWVIECKKKTGAFPVLPEESVWKDPRFDFKTFIAGVAFDSNTAPEVITPMMKLKNGIAEYNTKWGAADESDNFDQDHLVEIIKAEKLADLRIELKNEMYSELVLELETIQQQIAPVKASGKSAKAAKAKGKKEKSRATTAASDGRQLQADPLVLQLISKWSSNGFVTLPKPVAAFDKLVGTFQMALRGLPLQTYDSESYVRNLTEMFAVPLCLSSSGVAVTTPLSLLMFGIAGSGMLSTVLALANCVGAKVLNCSPEKLESELKDDPGTITSMFKTAKAIAPSIIFIDNAELIFSKKAAKGVTLDIKAVKKEFAKNMKTLKSTDRVLICGRTTAVSMADPSQLQSVFEVFACPSPPSHSTRVKLWNKVADSERHENALELSSMFARLSNGLTTAEVMQAIQKLDSMRRSHKRSYSNKTMVDIQKMMAVFSRIEDTSIVAKHAELVDWYGKNMVSSAPTTAG